jgi:dihydrofolate reductase
MKLIVAKDLNGAIGRNGDMPWHLGDDLKMFRQLTSGGTVLMGRKTYESIGKPLPNRHNLVLTKSHFNDFEAVKSIEEALQIDPNIWVIGGGEIYRQTIEHCTELFLTVVHTNVKDADTFFPNVDMFDWITVSSESFYKNEKNDFDFNFYHLLRQ